MTKEQDLIYVRDILSGKTGSYVHIISSTKSLVAQIVHRMIVKEWYREDIIQEIYIKVFQNLPYFRNESRLSTWIAKIAYNLCLNELKSNRTKRPYPDKDLLYFHEPALDPLQQLAARDLKDWINLEIDRLPPVYRTIVVLYHQQELSIEEIHEITSLPSGTVKNYLFRARAVLAHQLNSKYNQTDFKYDSST